MIAVSAKEAQTVITQIARICIAVSTALAGEFTCGSFSLYMVLDMKGGRKK